MTSFAEYSPDISYDGQGFVRYEDDAFCWAQQQAALLRAGRFDELDVPNIADEIADIAAREYDTLVAQLARVLEAELQWDFRPTRRCRSWVARLHLARRQVRRQLRRYPGLAGKLNAALAEAYQAAWYAVLRGAEELPMAALPKTLPYGWTEVMDRAIVMDETPRMGLGPT